MCNKEIKIFNWMSGIKATENFAKLCTSLEIFLFSFTLKPQTLVFYRYLFNKQRQSEHKRIHDFDLF